jgi:hypothetical protein
MMTFATSQHRNVLRPRRSSIGHGAACPDTQRGPLRKTRLPINAPSLGRNDPLSHRTVADQCARSIGRNSHTAPAALKSP